MESLVYPVLDLHHFAVTSPHPEESLVASLVERDRCLNLPVVRQIFGNYLPFLWVTSIVSSDQIVENNKEFNTALSMWSSFLFTVTNSMFLIQHFPFSYIFWRMLLYISSDLCRKWGKSKLPCISFGANHITCINSNAASFSILQQHLHDIYFIITIMLMTIRSKKSLWSFSWQSARVEWFNSDA